MANRDGIPNEAEVVVVGAGLSGITAARDLTASGAECLVLEARGRVGGRVLGQSLGEGVVADMGGEYFGPLGSKIEGLARSVGVTHQPVHDEGHKVTELGERVHRYKGFLPRVGMHAVADCAQAVLRFEQMVRKVPPEAPWAAPKAREWDSQTLASWVRRNFRTSAGRAIFEMATEAIWCGSAADISLLHALFYAHSYGSFEYLGSVRNGSQERRFTGGSQSIVDRVADDLGDRVVLDASVHEIEYSDDSVRITGAGYSVSARYAIVAVPPVLAGRISYEPALPVARDQITQRMPPGSVIKYLAVYERPFWRETGLSGQATSARGPVRVAFDCTPPQGVPGVIGAFVSGTPARELARMPPGRRRQLTLESLARLFGRPALAPEQLHEKDWTADPWTRGCYNGLAVTGALTQFGRALREPVGALHWASAEAGIHANGSMGGAVDAGERAAEQVLERLALSRHEPARAPDAGLAVAP